MSLPSPYLGTHSGKENKGSQGHLEAPYRERKLPHIHVLPFLCATTFLCVDLDCCRIPSSDFMGRSSLGQELFQDRRLFLHTHIHTHTHTHHLYTTLSQSCLSNFAIGCGARHPGTQWLGMQSCRGMAWSSSVSRAQIVYNKTFEILREKPSRVSWWMKPILGPFQLPFAHLFFPWRCSLLSYSSFRSWHLPRLFLVTLHQK